MSIDNLKLSNIDRNDDENEMMSRKESFGLRNILDGQAGKNIITLCKGLNGLET